jgi:hypothetical protein
VYDLTNFSLSDMTRCGIALRKLGSNASSMEEVARRVVEMLYRDLVMPGSSDGAAALVRTFVTLPYSDLQPDQQEFARHVLPEVASTPAMKCLTLLATAGQEPEWNARRGSTGHQALPLPSEDGISRSPMIAQLIRQLGIEAGSLLNSDASVVLDSTQHTFNVFHVPDALGSPYIPAQTQFVVRRCSSRSRST